MRSRGGCGLRPANWWSDEKAVVGVHSTGKAERHNNDGNSTRPGTPRSDSGFYHNTPGNSPLPPWRRCEAAIPYTIGQAAV